MTKYRTSTMRIYNNINKLSVSENKKKSINVRPTGNMNVLGMRWRIKKKQNKNRT